MPRFYVYVLHTERKLADHAQHYVGATDDLLTRLIAHATGRGACITRAYAEQGIEWRVATVYVMEHRCQFLAERRIKRQKQYNPFCGVCSDECVRSIAGAMTVDLDTLGIPLTSRELRELAHKPKG